MTLKILMLLPGAPAEGMKYEVGTKVLDSIPEAVKVQMLVDFGSLPRIMASYDALVKDEGSGGTPHSPSGHGSCHCLHCTAFSIYSAM